MVNCNPETVSTDYDTADRLYFEPLTFEDVLEVVARRARGRPGRWGHRATRRPDPAGTCAAAADSRGADRRHRRRSRSTWPRTGGRSAGCWPRRGCPRRARHGDLVRRGEARSPTRSVTRCWSGRLTCSVAVAWRSCTTTRPCASTSTGRPSRARSTPCWSTGSWTTPSRSTWTRSVDATRGLPRRHHGAHRGGRHPLRRLGLRPAADHAGPRPNSPRSARTPRRSPAASASAGC